MLSVPALSRAEEYVPPNNVKDPLKPVADRRQTDLSLPFIYLEPHDGCFDTAKPVNVTIFAVNRSGAALTIDWRTVVESLTLDAFGPGTVKPLTVRRFDRVEVKPQDSAKLTFDLKDRFSHSAGSVYRLSYARPLEDGRFHVADGVQFVVEDFAAIDRLAAQLESGAGRNTFTELLKQNVFFAGGGMPKSYGWDLLDWRDRPEMRSAVWDESLQKADKLWRDGIVRLTDHGGHPRAVEMLLDRLLLLSDNFRGTPNHSLREYFDQHASAGLAPADRERFLLKLASTHDRASVSRAMNRLMGMKSKAGIDLLIRIVDGPDEQLGSEAIASLSSYRTDPRIALFLRRKMTDVDPNLALEAAIVSCYSGDWSGVGLLLRAARCDTPSLRLKAIAQIGDPHFRAYANKIVPILLDELKSPTSIDHLERAIESLGAYPSQKVLDAVKPFLTHTNSQVSARARLVVASLEREIKPDH
jgi:hypothetical protein